MREKEKVQTILKFPSSSTTSTRRSSSTDENTPKKNESPKVAPKKKVNFLSPPKWRIKHSVRGANKSPPGRGVSQRAALRTLHHNERNGRLLVGRGSPRIAAVGKGKPPAQSTSPLSSRLSKMLSEESRVETREQCTQTEDTSTLDHRMVTQEEPPSEYWQVLAERRRLALSETLKENEDLHSEIAGLKRRVNELENRTHDLEYFAMMYELISKVDSQL